jgi:hypothetical protein
MPHFLNQLDTNRLIKAELTFGFAGTNGPPKHAVAINGESKWQDTLQQPSVLSVVVEHEFFLLSSLVVEVAVWDKDYDLEPDSALIIEDFQIDNVSLLPDLIKYSRYINDKNWTEPTTHLGFNGVWQYIIPEPFYRWHHKVTGQGWLLYP